MNQKVAWSLVLAGVGLFLYQLGELLTQHTAWAELREPASVGEVVKIAAFAVLAVLGALGVKLPPGGISGALGKLLGGLVLAAAIGGLAPGCALIGARLGVRGDQAPAAAQLEATRIAGVLERIGHAVVAVQDAEIALHRAGRIADADHLVFQAHALAWADAMLALEPALLDLARPEASRRDVVRQAVRVTDRLIEIGLVPIRDEAAQLRVRVLLASVEAMLPLLELLI